MATKKEVKAYRCNECDLLEAYDFGKCREWLSRDMRCEGEAVEVKFVEDRHVQFFEDCDEAGLKVEWYRGRFFYEGPAVVTDRNEGPSFEDIARATTCKLRTDGMGRDLVVYPA